jgi:hypothetical protein
MKKPKDPIKAGRAEALRLDILSTLALPAYQRSVGGFLEEAHQTALDRLAKATDASDIMRAQGEYRCIRRIFDRIISHEAAGQSKQDRRLEQLKSLIGE